MTTNSNLIEKDDLSSSEILETFRLERGRIICDLLNNPNDFFKYLWTPKSSISYDRECRVKSGQGACNSSKICKQRQEMMYPFREKYYECNKCHKLEKLVDLNELELNKPFRSTIIDDKNMKQYNLNLVINSFIITSEKEKINNQFIERVKKIIKNTLCDEEENKPFIESNPFGVDLINAQFVPLDSFTINILISWIFEKIMKNTGKPHYNRIHTAFVCSNTGFILEDVSIPYFVIESDEKYERFRRDNILDHKISEGIILQLLVIFHFIKKFALSISNVSFDCLGFSTEPCKYVYENKKNINVKISCPVTVKIKNFMSSGITIKKQEEDKFFRVYTQNVELEKAINCTFNDKFLNLKIMSNDKVYFKIANNNNKTCDYLGIKTIFTHLWNAGAPYFNSQLNFYSFFILLCMRSTFYYSVKASNKLTKLWYLMFLPEQMREIETRLETHLSCSNIPDPLSILDGIYLNSNILDEGLMIYKGKTRDC
jgi:hypothetical protein